MCGLPFLHLPAAGAFRRLTTYAAHMQTRSWCVRLVLTTLSLLILTGVGTAAAAPVPVGHGGVFAIDCDPTVRKPLDPILMPGMLGMSHSHDFFGPRRVATSATIRSLSRRVRQPTSCSLRKDQSTYWMPSLLYGGAVSTYQPQPLQVYYRLDEGARAIPKGLVMIAGNAAQVGPASDSQSASWSCQPSSDYNQTVLPDCTVAKTASGGFLYDDVMAELMFPSCWDGTNLDSADHKSHVAYPSEDGVCDQGHPVRIARINLFRSYVQDPGHLMTPSLVTLASGLPSTLHADFISAWNPRDFNALITRCAATDCGHLTNAGAVKRATAPRAATVVASDFAFTASTVTIARGGRVTWRFAGQVGHNVHISKGSLHWYSPIKTTGQVSRVFKQAGRYPYVCTIHPAMTGTVVVT